ncbi:RagB/SusD family nutrient uptake outer membrane protein [Mangrovibacterium sp.]|uniref:RagB/SusD family nutrient uptake outer membrane protein n=1 Tax=Mangrovibacterium sp. TaxID=1961364 RepID=UPI0035633D07
MHKVGSKAFVAIRAVNTVLENINLLKEYPAETGYTAEELEDQLIGQCYFLRAFHYFQIIRRYGGYTIMNQVFGPDHDFDKARPSYLQSSDSLVADLDKAIKLLPVKWNDQNKGRVTKTTAQALKGMALLYAASPLMNPQLNPYGSSSKEYNLEYAEKAVFATLEAIESYAEGGYQMYSKEDYTKNWYRREYGFSDEALLVPPLSSASSPDGTGLAGKGWFLPQFMGGWLSEGQPTQNAVDWFETADGYDVNDPDAITSGSFDPANPYENRDPRLKMLVFVHGDDMYGELSSPTSGVPRDLQATPDGYHYKYEEGKSKFWCGYYHKGKHRWPGCDKWHTSTGWYRNFPHIRVAQLYLDFAEAANEVYGPTGAVPGTSLTAVGAINLLRQRVDMPPVLAKYTTDSEAFKERIYNERAVELYHEFHRWFDLRRWKLAKEVLPQGIYAADIRKVDGQLVYGKKKLETSMRVFEDKHYWYPFPTDMMNMMSEFEQNPGW